LTADTTVIDGALDGVSIEIVAFTTAFAALNLLAKTSLGTKTLTVFKDVGGTIKTGCLTYHVLR
jgi:hypothetical protein